MQTYYQFYWEKKDGENIKILRVLVSQKKLSYRIR